MHLVQSPVANSLLTHHRHLSIRGKLSIRYQPGTLSGGAVDEQTAAAYTDLRQLTEAGEVLYVQGVVSAECCPGWEILGTMTLSQMVCEALRPAPAVPHTALTAADVPDMLALVALAQPGPFLPRTVELGRYLGIRREGQLVAMAGERMHPPGCCEISAVCTHPDHRGKGYAASLVTALAQLIIAQGETPFLHHAHGNLAARRVYERLGFQGSGDVTLTALSRLADDA